MDLSRRRFLEMGAGAAALSGCDTAATERGPQTFVDAGWRPREMERLPNIVMVVLDDVGFSDLGCYGSEIPTPAMDSVAAAGTKFNNFHVTALCSPTRACLFTGRNAHAVGVGSIVEWGRPELPGYKGWIRKDATMLPEILQGHGYGTSAIGKWHLSTIEDQSGAGPYDLWPTGRGFDQWYGFHGSAVDHWHPEMWEGTRPAYPDKPHVRGDESYHLSEDLVDHSIKYIRDHVSTSPERPFFQYVGFGATHFPLHAPSDDIRAQKGRYDAGWDALREERWARQQAMGFLPEHARLSEPVEGIPSWASMNANQRLVARRQAEVYAAFLEHTDRQVGRLIDELKRQGVYDNTIFMVMSDNGASYGGPTVGYHDVRRASYLGEPFEAKLMHYEKLGSEESQSITAPGWSHASNTPLKWFKGDSYGGGTRAPLILSWPDGGIEAGGLRGQYTHVVDMLPTLMTMTGLAMPDAELKVQGTSFAYAFDNADAPDAKMLQYYEVLGDRAIYRDGWKAVARHTRGEDFEDDRWELYHVAEDYSETRNLSEARPDLLAELIGAWRAEAEAYDVLPLTDETVTLFAAAVPAPRESYLFFPGAARLDRMSAPDILKYDSQVRAQMSCDAPASGVILASGDSGGGYEFYMQDGVPHFVYVYVREDVVRVSGPQVGPGDHVFGFEIKKTGPESGRVFLTVNGEIVADSELPRMWPIYYVNSGVRCGANPFAPISFAYTQPFAFDQTLHRVVVDLDL